MMHILEKDLCLESAAHFHPRSYTEGILVPSIRPIHPLISGHIYFLFVMSIFIASVVSCDLFFSSTNTPPDFENFVLYLFSH